MKKVYAYLADFFREDFSPVYYSVIAVFLCICICINYYFDFEDSIIDAYAGQNIRILYFFLFYSVAYYGAAIITSFFNKKSAFLSKKEFWLKSLLILSVISLDASFHYHIKLLYGLPQDVYYVLQKILLNLSNLITTILPLTLFYWLFEKDKSRFYGFTLKGFDSKPYIQMLLILIPIIGAASFVDNFSDFYPMYKANTAYQNLGVSEWVPAIAYELAYGWNFVTVELMFRGFMVVGMARVMGRDCIVPMIATYCFYHFGKPEGEAISSIFGGLILGVIALKTRSIYGGVILHVGLAWMMELFAYLQNKF